MGVVVRRYVDILIIIITFPTPLVLRSSFFGSSIPTSWSIFKCIFVLVHVYECFEYCLRGL